MQKFCRIGKLHFLLLSVLIAILTATVSFAAVGEKKQVVFIRYRIAPTYFITVVDAFKKSMASQGFEEGVDIEYIDILTRSADKSSVPDVIDAVNKYKDSADMFITCGWVSMYAREILKNSSVPQLFVPVLESVAKKMLSSISEVPNTNLSGIYLMYPPEKILRITRLMLPSLKTYAYVYDSNIPADVVFKNAYQELSTAELHNIDLVFIDLANGIDKAIAAMQEKHVGAFGGIVGAFKHRVELARTKIPVITSFTLDITQDSIKEYVEADTTIAGLFNPFSYCGEQAAEMTSAIFSKTKTIEATPPRAAKQLAFINLIAAKRLGVSISFEAIEAVDLIIK